MAAIETVHRTAHFAFQFDKVFQTVLWELYSHREGVPVDWKPLR